MPMLLLAADRDRRAKERINTVEAVNVLVQRARIGVCRHLAGQVLQKFLDAILWRRDHCHRQVKSRNKKISSGIKTIAATV